MNGHTKADATLRWASLFAAVLVVLGVTLSAVPAAAEQGDDEQGDEDQLESFEKHVSSGARLQKQGEHRRALEQFSRARQIADHPKLMLVSGQLREEIGDCPGAREDYRNALEDGRAGERLSERLEVALEDSATCDSRGLLVVQCSPATATLHLQDRRLECGEEAELAAGTHTMEARAEGYMTRQLEVTIEPGGEHHEEVALTERPEQPAQPAASSDPISWMNWAAYGGMGLGASLLVGGLISDSGASSRQRELHAATEDGDVEQTEHLVDEAESAKTRTALLYGSGAVLTAAGALLWVYDEEAAHWLFGEGDSAVGVDASVDADSVSLGARLRW